MKLVSFVLFYKVSSNEFSESTNARSVSIKALGKLSSQSGYPELFLLMQEKV